MIIVKSVFLLFIASLTTLPNAISQTALFIPAPSSPISVAGGPGNVALGDINLDSKPDIVVACGQARTVSVLLGRGDGSFALAPKSPISVPGSPGEMALGDVNGDGKLDIAFADHDSYGVTLLLGDGKGSFSLAPLSPFMMRAGNRPHTHGLELGDLNGDRILDLVTVNNNDYDVSVALGDGRGGFERVPRSPFPVGQSPYPPALGDLNMDGNLDIIATTTMTGRNVSRTPTSSKALTVLFGDGRGGFLRRDIPIRTAEPWCVAVGDVNRDSKPDMVITHQEASPLTVLLGDGKGNFAETSRSPFDLGHSAWRVVIADVNCDGKVDILAAADTGMRVMLGDGHGGFTAAPGSPFPVGKGAWRLAVSDLNRDGKPDVVTSNVESNNITVYLGH